MNVKERWAESEDGTLKPVISCIHVIPLEDRESLLHCAQLSCWCSPKIDAKDNCLILHNALTKAKQGWILVGEY